MNALKQLLIVEHYLNNAVVVAQVDKHDTAVVADILYPAGSPYLFAYIVFSHRVAVLRAVFVFSEQFLQSFQYINCRRLTGGKVLSYGHSDYDRHCYAALYHSLSAGSSPSPHNSTIYYITKMRNCQ